MMRIYKEFSFEAAHYLPSAPADHRNARIHGHSFRVRITVEGTPDPETGFVVHFDAFEMALAAIQEQLDHRLLNDVAGLESPTLERIAAWMWTKLSATLPGLSEVHLSRPSCGEGCICTGTGSELPL